ncbi:antitoxin Xre/MbcA/ParS toxin-binding domain-containing protein [Pseudomonas triticicola]|uniref:antitoxin Xre/MbcA/ParS toxin-binding domain-containing protein n=1 Tax=Pseudomonas triticicola TaxID=2842345 RepID=UPI003EBD263F
MSESLRWTVRCKDTGDGSGDATLNLPRELFSQTGLGVGDVLTIEVVNSVIVLQPLQGLSTPSSSAKALREDFYQAYRMRLETYLHIPPQASDQAIHELIEAGFPANSLQVLCDQGIINPAELDRIVPYRTFKKRLASNQRLKVDESDRMYRAVNIIAMAVTVFGDTEKARNWLSKPKSRFSGKSPCDLLATSLGGYRVEEMLIQVAEGFYC